MNRTTRHTLMAYAALLLTPLAAICAAVPLVVEKLEGPVTATELQAFKNYMRDVPVPTNNIRNAMVYGCGMAVETLGRMVEVSGDQQLLDRMLAFTDAMLVARNDPKTGAIIWTGGRELVWPSPDCRGSPSNWPAAWSAESRIRARPR